MNILALYQAYIIIVNVICSIIQIKIFDYLLVVYKRLYAIILFSTWLAVSHWFISIFVKVAVILNEFNWNSLINITDFCN